MTKWSEWSQEDDDRHNAVCRELLRVQAENDMNYSEFIYCLEVVKFDLLWGSAAERHRKPLQPEQSN